MKDYLVRDECADEHAIVEAPSPIDAVQRYVNIPRNDNYRPDPHDIRVFPITRKNSIILPVDPLNGDRE